MANETGAGVAPDDGDIHRADAPSEPHGRLRPAQRPERSEPLTDRTEPALNGPARGREIRTAPGADSPTGPAPENPDEPGGIETASTPEPPRRVRPTSSPARHPAPRHPTPSIADGAPDAGLRSRPWAIKPALDPAAEPTTAVAVSSSTASPAPDPQREPRTHGRAAADPQEVRPPMLSAPGTSVPFSDFANAAGQPALARASHPGAPTQAADDPRERTTTRSAGTPQEPMWADRPAPPAPMVGRLPSQQDAGRSHLTDAPHTDITVTIGRVEVKVPPAAPVRQPPSSRPRRHPPSLEEYLTARARGLAG
jgi:hypothetical protein